MTSNLRDFAELLESQNALLRPLGFYDPKGGSVGAYPELPIGRCRSTSRFSNFHADFCGELDQWHAHFPLVGSPIINSVIGIHLPDSNRIAGFISLPSENKLDFSLVEPIFDHGVVPELLPSRLAKSMSRICQLGKAPAVEKLYIGSSNLRSEVFVEVACGFQEFDVYGIFEDSPRAEALVPGLSKPSQTYLDELAAIWLDQPEIWGSYLAGFMFLASEISTSFEARPVDHEKVQEQAVKFRFPREGVTPNVPEWRINASLAMARYISNPTPELARDAASWLKSAEIPAWAEFHFPDIDDVEPKAFPVSRKSVSANTDTVGRCRSCGQPFEFDSDKFCGSCGNPRRELQ